MREAHRRTTLLAVLLWLAAPVAAQDKLPGGFAGWLPAQARSEQFASGQVERLAGDPADAAILREYGLVQAERRAYRKEGAELTVTLYQFRDSTGAYGAFSFLRTPELGPSHLGELAAASKTRGLLGVHNLLLDVTGADLGPLVPDLQALANAVAPRSERSPYPTLGQYLPPKALPGTARFVLGPQALARVLPSNRGDWLGFANSAEVELARYRQGGREVTLLLAAYPTPQVALQQERALDRWFNVNAAEEPVPGRPVVFVRRMTSVVAIVLEAESWHEARALIGQVNYETQLTWNEPSHLATDPPWSHTIYNIFLGTMYFMGFALASGVVFGGFRLAMKKLFPGKVFDRESSVGVIQLGLTSKPIQGKDFYHSE